MPTPAPFPCQASDTLAVCDDRRAAVRAGTFVYDWQRRAWVMADAPLRSASWRARFFEIGDGDGEPYHWTVCPWCGGDLPDLAALREAETKALGQGDGDGPEV